jgi:sulfite reductase beta subunit-like hemoprotein
MYITFAKKNSSMSDGYYDYVQGIPDDYRNELRAWIRDGKNFIPSGGENLAKKLKFKIKGVDTNDVSASIDFTISISAVYGGGAAATT